MKIHQTFLHLKIQQSMDFIVKKQYISSILYPYLLTKRTKNAIISISAEKMEKI